MEHIKKTLAKHLFLDQKQIPLKALPLAPQEQYRP
jgi:hypothetical protein